MAAAFAALEDRLNQAVFLRLANAVAILSGWVEVPVIFDKAYQGVLGGLAESNGPQASALSADVCSLAQGDPVVINNTTYKVTTVQPDGTGITLLELELA